MGDAREKGPGRARPAECFSENAVSGKTNFKLFAPVAQTPAEGFFFSFGRKRIKRNDIVALVPQGNETDAEEWGRFPSLLLR